MDRSGGPGKCFQRRYRYYEILEISRDATPEETREAFRRLAQKYHPDHNPGNSEAEARFKKINEAYQVLSNPSERAAYDSSPAECPACWTYKVAEKGGGRWWCIACGCEFDAFGIPLSEKIERAAISERYRVRLAAFQSMQCSWCRKFFTQPFLCPDRKLHSSCFSFDELSEEERGKFLNDEKWWWRIVDLVRQAENNGVIKKCVRCGALNPNPEKFACWRCKHNIYDRCPKCGLPTLYFDLDDDVWKCSNAVCYGKRFTIHKLAPGTKEPVYVLRKRCLNCRSDLHFDFATRLWRCSKCQSVYTYDELRKVEVEKESSGQKPSLGPSKASKEGREAIHIWSLGYKTFINKKITWLAKRKISNWLLGLILIFSLAIIGLVISIVVGSIIPFWLLLGFSSVFAVEKWYYYQTRRHKVIGISYRLLLNLGILSLFGLIIWTGAKLFSKQFVDSPLVGSLIFLAEFVFFVWMWRVVDKNSWRWPSMKLTVFSLVCLFLVFSFAGVQPIASYKDAAVQWTQAKITPVASDIRHSLFPTDEEIQADTFTLVNKARVEAGLAPLVRDSTLDSLAQEHCDYMKRVGNVNHDNFDERADRSGRSYVGENCAEGYYAAESLVNGWLSSPGHKANIMNPYFVYTGLGYTGGYACQIFSD